MIIGLLTPGKSNTDGNIPAYTKSAEFVLLMNMVATTPSQVQIEDMELAVARSLKQVLLMMSKKLHPLGEVPFNAEHELRSTGESIFDYVSIEHQIPVHFRPPKKKFEINGRWQRSNLKPEWITISPDDDDPSHYPRSFCRIERSP